MIHCFHYLPVQPTLVPRVQRFRCCWCEKIHDVKQVVLLGHGPFAPADTWEAQLIEECPKRFRYLSDAAILPGNHLSMEVAS